MMTLYIRVGKFKLILGMALNLCPALPLVHRHRGGSASVALVEGLFLDYFWLLKQRKKISAIAAYE